jgi:hypothetical protein
MQREDYDRLYRRMLLDLWHAKDSDLDGIAAQVANDDLVIRQNGAEQHGVPHSPTSPWRSRPVR